MNTFAEDASRFERPVVCQWCNNKHRRVVPEDVGDNTQGDACAGHVFQVTEEMVPRFAKSGARVKVGEWLVKGNYGSSDYDTRVFRFVKNPPKAEADPICDNCIGERIMAEDLQTVQGHFP
jgi:hypothetical protein